MKKTTCKDLKGVCGTIITGRTPEEMGENSRKHVMEMISAGDQAHIEAAEKMKSMDKTEFSAWYENFKNSFDSLSDAEEQ